MIAGACMISAIIASPASSKPYAYLGGGLSMTYESVAGIEPSGGLGATAAVTSRGPVAFLTRVDWDQAERFGTLSLHAGVRGQTVDRTGMYADLGLGVASLNSDAGSFPGLSLTTGLGVHGIERDRLGWFADAHFVLQAIRGYSEVPLQGIIQLRIGVATP